MKKFSFIISFLLLTAVFTAPFFVSAAENAGIKPGSFFYGFVTTFEKVNLFFTFSPEKKAEKALKYAEKRLAEAEAVAGDKNSDAVKTAISGYEKNIAIASEASKKVKDETKAETLLNLIAKNTSKHQEVLVDVLSKVPDEAKEAITKALEASRKGQEEATKQIAELKTQVEQLKKEVVELKKQQGASSATPPQNTNAENQSTSIKELKKEIDELKKQQSSPAQSAIPASTPQTPEKTTNIVTLPSGAVVEMDTNGNIVRTIKETPATQSVLVVLSGDDIMSHIAPSVVLISTPCCTGSGFVVNEGRLIVTNAHVVNREDTNGHILERYSIVEMTLYGGKVIRGTVLGRDEVTDLAIVSTGNERPQAVVLGSSAINGLKVGIDVFALGYPRKLANLTLTKGILSSRQILNGQSFLQTDAALNPGNSGGPLVNNKGEIIGMNVSRLLNTEGIGFAIPIDVAKEVISNLSSGIENLIFDPIAGSNLAIPRSIVSSIGFNPNLSCDQLGYFGNNLKLCNLYKNNQSDYQWTIDENQ